jgi:CRISPR-associated protein Cmr2
MVRSTTWKGVLRFSAIKVFEDWIRKKLNNSEKIDKETVFRERTKIVRLFGNEKDSQENYLGKLCLIAMRKDQPSKKEIEEINKEFDRWLIDKGMISKDVPSRSGRLFFYPTFFDKISLDVITPLSRETRTPVKGRAPIYFEIVPENTEGIFRLFYYPFDLVAKGEFDKIENEVKEDLEFLAKALKKMFYEIGFSAKKTSGFGTADVKEVKIKAGEKLKRFENEIKEYFESEFKDKVEVN